MTIDNVRPGDTVAFHGDTLTVSADVSGLRQDEPVTLFYSTADGQSVDQAIDHVAHRTRKPLPVRAAAGQPGIAAGR